MLLRCLVNALVAPLVLCATETFPDPLVMDNFKTRTQHGLHLVEFFSPYCSHCKHLAPTWEKTWEDFHEEGKNLGIGMVQVDCVASGDLCNQEKITAYPALKLYGPNGYIKDYPRRYKRNEESIIKFMKDVVIELADPNLLIDSKSKFLTTDAMIKILGESQKSPQLISFWPSLDLEDMNVFDKDKFDTNYDDDCLDFQRSWTIVSNQVQSLGVETGHFNCKSNSKICKKLELPMDKPSVLLVLPNTNIAKVIEFDQNIYDMTYKEILTFTKRMLEISQVREVNSWELLDSGFTSARLEKSFEFPESSEWNFVYVYDSNTQREDFEILPYLIEPLSKLPNTHLFKSNDSGVLSIMDIQQKNIYRSLNYNKEEKRSLSDQRSIIETMTSLPTLVAFKDNMLMPRLFQNFAPNEIRDQYKVIDWLNEVAGFPGYQEITPTNFKKFMKSGDLSNKLAILLLDKTSEKDCMKYQDNFIIGVHDYNEVKNEVRYQKIMKDRDIKQETVLELKEKNSDSKDIVKAIGKEIPYLKFPEVVFGYLDLNENLQLLNRLGIDIHERKFSNGDVLIFDRSTSYYYENDSKNDNLNVRDSPFAFREALAILNDVQKGALSKRLRNSPFPSIFRFMEPLHHRFTYLIVLVVLIAVYKKFKQGKPKDNLGILGNPMAKFD